MNTRQLFEACRNNDAPIEVINVAGSAADNAAATINENGGRFVQGHFTDEFMAYWFMTVQGILCDSECPAEARDWFAARGVRA